MNISIDAVYILGSYLFGSIPHLSALARLQHIHIDGDYHLTLWSKGNKILFCIGILGEFAKSAIPVVLGRYLGFDVVIVAVSGLAAVCGQMWPVFRRFDGEKGNTVGLAMAAALTIFPLLLALVPIAIGVSIRTGSRLFDTRRKIEGDSVIGGSFSRSMPLAMMGGFLVLPLASWLLHEPWECISVYIVLIILLLIRRLTAGLSHDLEISSNIKQILVGRLLYDRGVSQYRVNTTAVR